MTAVGIACIVLTMVAVLCKDFNNAVIFAIMACFWILVGIYDRLK